MTRLGFITAIALLMCFCSEKNRGNRDAIATRTINQISNHHGGLGKDSVILINKNDKSEFYDRIQIYRGQELIFDHTEEDLEIIGTPENTFVEHRTDNGYFYIFKIFGGPSPNSFLVIKTSKSNTDLFGKTDTNSADIFGDIDYDGKFEIGGWTDYCQEDESHKCPDLELYNVFELDNNFPTDTTLTTFFRHLIKTK